MKPSQDQSQYPAKSKWQSADEAAAYRQARDPRSSSRYQRENQILAQWLGHLPAGAAVLDVPCGAGRFTPFLQESGYQYVGVDVALPMIHEAQKISNPSASRRFANADAQKLPFPDNSFDCVILWRLLHHISSSAVREAIFREAARVTRDRVIVTFHHPCSFTSLRLRLRRWLGDTIPRWQVSHWQLQQEAGRSGLALVEFKSFRKFVSINWFGAFRKPA